jgi:O-antigen/teichoic acid export membrane protein
MSKQKKIGSLLSYALILIKLVTTFFYIPFVLNSIGKEDYGLFSIVGALMAYIAILDLGASDSTLRYFVKFRVEKNTKIKYQIIGSVSNIYKLIALLVALGSIIVYLLIDPLYQASFSGSQMKLFKEMFIISSISIFFTLFFNPAGAILSAYERFIFLKTTEIVSFVLTTITIVIFLYNDFGVFYIVLIASIFNLINILIRLYYVRHTLQIKYPTFNKHKGFQKELLLYSLPILTVVIVEQIYWKLDNIIIGSLLGPSLVTLFAMGVVFQKYILSFSTAISRIMSPGLIKNIDLNQSMLVLTKSYIKTSRIQLIVVLLIMLNLIVFGDVFFQLWLGEEYSISFTIFLIVMIPFSIEIIGNLRNTFLQVFGFYWYRAAIILVISILNIFSTIILLNKYGIEGAAWSTSISLVLGYTVTNYLMHKKIKMSLKPFFEQVWLKALPSIILVLGLGFTIKTIISINNWVDFSLSITLTSTIYLVSLYFFYLEKHEKASILFFKKLKF